MPDMQGLVNELIDKLKKRRVKGSLETPLQTAELLRSVISVQKLPPTNKAAALINAVRDVGEKLIAANPVELSVGNVIRRVLHIIREEDLSPSSDEAGDNEEEITWLRDNTAPYVAEIIRPPLLHMLHTFSSAEEKSKSYIFGRSRKLKHDVIEAINMLIEDVNICYELIAEQAVEHIHHNETILTLGWSRTVLEFLLAAKDKKRSFHVFVAEGAPRCHGHALAQELVGRGLKTTVIADASVFAMISRVNMVIVGVHAVMANGGVIAPVGMDMVALAAQKFAVPVVVVAGIHKLRPLYPENPEVSLNDMRSPSELLELGKFSDCMDFGSVDGAPLVHVANPVFDYVPPELVSLVITDIGGHKPSYIYRLIADYYSSQDYVRYGRDALFKL
ncbi:translation initiation factor eIF-2B subunit beta-like [Coffea eugenioides]|uniref:translation initiation factor eIF-2B subunit beta-like n=1 Tax=Coffea eugenioides TaxID=49369 RepID=UPI000F60E209|nr:translation initiation factor eIF-2B subunit beta-like [Coffea eugenioides]